MVTYTKSISGSHVTISEWLQGLFEGNMLWRKGGCGRRPRKDDDERQPCPFVGSIMHGPPQVSWPSLSFFFIVTEFHK